MTLSFKHLFQSGKSNSADASIVRPTDWNAEHDVELTGPALVGRTAASQGAAAEIVLSGALGIVSDTLKVFVPGYTNAEITESHGSNAATFALKTTAGADATTADPITALFGDGTTFSITAALSVTIPSTAMMGARNGIPFRLWFVLINDGGTARLGVRNCVTTIAGAGQGSTVTAISGFSDHGTLSSTIMDTSSNNAGVTYTNTAVTTDPFVVLGYADYDSGLATVGTWNASPSRIVMYGPGVPLPGQTVQIQRSTISTVQTGTTTIPSDNSIPQITEGNLFTGNSLSMTANSVQNLVRAHHIGSYSHSAGDTNLTAGLFQSVGGNNCLAEARGYASSVDIDREFILALEHIFLAATISAVTYSIRAGSSAAGTVSLNTGAAGHGNVAGSHFTVEELMG